MTEVRSNTSRFAAASLALPALLAVFALGALRASPDDSSSASLAAITTVRVVARFPLNPKTQAWAPAGPARFVTLAPDGLRMVGRSGISAPVELGGETTPWLRVSGEFAWVQVRRRPQPGSVVDEVVGVSLDRMTVSHRISNPTGSQVVAVLPNGFLTSEGVLRLDGKLQPLAVAKGEVEAFGAGGFPLLPADLDLYEGKVYASHKPDGGLRVIDLRSLEVVREIPTREDLGGVAAFDSRCLVITATGEDPEPKLGVLDLASGKLTINPKVAAVEGLERALGGALTLAQEDTLVLLGARGQALHELALPPGAWRLGPAQGHRVLISGGQGSQLEIVELRLE